MAKYQITNKAILDLTSIWNYTFNKWSEQQADEDYRMLISTFVQLANKSIEGKPYKEIRSDLFGFSANKHIIFYRNLKDDNIEITRILHQKMDLKNN